MREKEHMRVARTPQASWRVGGLVYMSELRRLQRCAVSEQRRLSQTRLCGSATNQLAHLDGEEFDHLS